MKMLAHVCSLDNFRFAPACRTPYVAAEEVAVWGRLSPHPKVPCHSGILQTYSSRKSVDAYSASNCSSIYVIQEGS